jgi:hypothetical protein
VQIVRWPCERHNESSPEAPLGGTCSADQEDGEVLSGATRIDANRAYPRDGRLTPQAASIHLG